MTPGASTSLREIRASFTEPFRRIHHLVAAGEHQAARSLLPRETANPLSRDLAARIGTTQP